MRPSREAAKRWAVDDLPRRRIRPGRQDHLPVPLRVGSLVSLVVYALLAMVLPGCADLVSTGVPDGVRRTAAWVVVSYSFLGIGLNLLFRRMSERR